MYGGMSGSGAENTKLLRDLGLTRYGVQNEAINSLGKIQGQIPTVRPFDPTGIIAAQLDAQERADMYAAAPVPEDAYMRAMGAADPGWGGRGRGGFTVNPGWGGGSARPDPVMSGYGAPTIGYGTNRDASGGGSYAPWGSFPNALSAGGGGGAKFNDWLSTDYGPMAPQNDDAWLANIFGDDQDFGGSLGYGGGAAWNPMEDILGDFGGMDYGGSENFALSDFGDYEEDWY